MPYAVPVAKSKFARWQFHECPRQEDNVVQSDGHASARKRVAHVPCVADKHDTLLGGMGTKGGPGLTSGREERIWHAAEAVFFDGGPGSGLELRRELGNNIREDMALNKL
jgi:hypothetical protein